MNGENKGNKSGGNEGSKECSQEILHIPKKQMEEFLAKTQEHIKSIKEETESQIKSIKKEFNHLKKRPLGEFAEGFNKEIAESIEKKIVHAGIEKKSKEAVDSAVLRVNPYIENEAKSRIIDVLNRVYGSQDKTLEDSIRTQEKRRFWSKVRAWSFTTAALGALALGGYALYDSSRRTAESATGIAQRAFERANETESEMKKSKSSIGKLLREYDEKTSSGLSSHISEDDKWKKQYYGNQKISSDARAKEISTLEQKLAGQIRAKADKAEYDAGFADLKKDYDKLDELLQAGLRHNDGREKAYIEYKELSDATKTTLDEFIKKYSEFEKKAAMKENVESEIAAIRTIFDKETKPKIREYGDLIMQMQKLGDENAEKTKEFRASLNNLYSMYKEVEKRMQKLEEGKDR